MCGYARRHVNSRQMHELADLLSTGGLVIRVGVESMAHFYAAFGGAAGRQLNDLVINEAAPGGSIARKLVIVWRSTTSEPLSMLEI